METLIRNVRDLTQRDRSALEQILGQELLENQQLLIQVLTMPAHSPLPFAESPSADLPEWCHIYKGLTDEQIDELDRSIVRCDLSRDAT